MDKKFKITTDASKMDVNFIHDYLSNHSYWAKGRTMELVEKSLNNSLCFGIFKTNGKQVGFARVATDYVVFAWLMDVFVDEDHRGSGIGKMLIESIINYPALHEVNGIGLRTRDAHAFYADFGFERIPEPETWMFKNN